jgi:hypothetical protein
MTDSYERVSRFLTGYASQSHLDPEAIHSVASRATNHELAALRVSDLQDLLQRIADAQAIACEMREQLINGPESWDVDRIIEALSGSARTAQEK